jgi:4-hydroxymandelate oxidase
MIPYEELRARAHTALPPDVTAYYDAGSGDELTVNEASAAWRSLRLRPRVLQDVSVVSTQVTLLGTEVSAPIGIAPTAAHGFASPDGEVATAAAAADTGNLFVVSSRATARLATIAAAAGPWWMQIYVMADRGLSDEIARQATDAGARAMVVTVDTPVVATKRREPRGLRFPEPALLPELDEASDDALTQAPDVTAADIARFADLTGLPVVAKGVLTAEAAHACVDAGAQAVVVSNHGGRQLDGAIATAHALPEVAAAVGDRVEVYVDGGIQTGRDVLRALALGADAAWLGRPVLWALATGGTTGVRDLLADINADLVEALTLSGCPSPADVGADLIWPA